MGKLIFVSILLVLANGLTGVAVSAKYMNIWVCLYCEQECVRLFSRLLTYFESWPCSRKTHSESFAVKTNQRQDPHFAHTHRE